MIYDFSGSAAGPAAVN